ncbi:TIGR02680 family protein [Streptomyces xiamenensis]|uniref:TIGR02680 family protein n=1 Tax=Streptomyces xiamenensis TaxID=408015 RepID=UPI0037D4C584
MTSATATGAEAAAGRLPAPGRTRWQPLRAGLVDIFHYDAEEFWFRDGRLLLRGNNGTGKSKVLALTLPFLLDGDLSPHRVEPDADPKKRMEWNLLLGGEHEHTERLGYTWIEFGRRTEDGTEHFTTLGCGLKAVAGRGIARHWFFVTDRRIGPDRAEGGLRLLDNTGAAITRDRLAEALDGRGAVYDTATGYRRAVDEALFRLGEQRYGALVDLLVQLRQPQLSKRPSEKALSRALTESLPPMDQAVVADVAEAFRSLQEEQDQLTVMKAAEKAARAFAGHYRRYARIAARRKASAPRQTHSRYESLRTELSGAETQLALAREQLDAYAEALRQLADRRTALRARDRVLRDGPEMRSARELERVAEDAERTARDAERAESDRTGVAGDLARVTARLATARTRTEATAAFADAAGKRTGQAATAAGLGGEHTERVAGPLAEGAEGAEEDAVREAARQFTDRRARAVALVEGQLATAGAAVRALDRVRARLGDAEGELARRSELLADAEEAAGVAGEDYVAEVRAHLTRCPRLRPHLPGPEGVLDELTHWVTTLSGPDPARTAVREAAATAAGELAGRRSGLERDAQEQQRRRGALRAEHADLAAGGQRGPDTPYTRADQARTGRPGAPLWRLVDVTGTAGPTGNQYGGLEAALESSGLLDAWITPDGTLTPGAPHDTAITLAPPASGRTLAEVLRPAVDRADESAAAVPDATVAAVLAGIGLLGAGEPLPATGNWIALDGRFRLGALAGSWSKPAAAYLGEGARETARRARIAAIDTELVAVETLLTSLAAATEALSAEERLLAAETSSLPEDAGLRAAHASVTACVVERARSADRVTTIGAEVDEAGQAAEDATAELHELANDLALPADAEGLRAVAAALTGYREALAELWPAVREERAAHAVHTEAEREHERIAGRLAELTERSRAASGDALAAAEAHRTLAGTVGAAVAELRGQLAEVTDGLRRCDTDEEALRRDQETAIAARATAETLRTRVSGDIEQAVRERAAAIEALRRFTATGLLTVALPETDLDTGGESWAPEPAVRLARLIDRELQDVDDADAPWERVQRKVTEEFNELTRSLSQHGHTASARMLEDGLVVDVVFQGRERPVTELVTALATEVTDRELLLSAREQEILENHLITEVAGTLQELVSAAEQQVRGMNAELAERPTSTGMRLRLVWRPSRDAPGGLAAARQRLLRQSADAWTGADRAALGEFLQAQIDRARTGNATGTWLEHLTEALDYRAWHEFGIERHQRDRWQPATGPASGGERVLTVSLPLFAAASSHYASAGHPHAPRLVTLDEAFAGVDDDSRAKSLGLLAAFDLDVVMTSEREWGCYPQVPGLAIAQLSRSDEAGAVLVTRWEWDGRQRTRAAEPNPRESGLFG